MNPSVERTCNPQSSPISIVFENPLKAYFSGDFIFGKVIFNARENQSVQTFSVHLRGEFYYMKGDTEQVESILSESSPSDRGAGEGKVEMKFNLILKPTSPTSIQSPLGGIRYRVLATVAYSEGGSLQVVEASEPISVNHPLHLPEKCSERRVRTVERAGIICCIGSISAELGINSAFLLSGQAVVVSGSVFNGTHTSVQATVVNLVQSLQRLRDGKKIKRTVNSLQRGAVLPGKMLVWPSEYLTVPPLPPTLANLFFKTWYEIIMEIQKVGGKLIKLKIPVVIGNMSATEVSFPNSGSEDHKVEWKSSELQNESNEFMPLYVTQVL
ncbi:arrestin domain-containing protein 17 isoform X2 [Halyomorpha halys]|uniref:arrestin domain-containing protein 17 isoform X2 n=1 Tax=Halyomorpha halys TaxID=286706 RepID=UPI0006D4DFDE|nr:arrestin domain-containing protein 17-like [Halyomorpha halys]